MLYDFISKMAHHTRIRAGTGRDTNRLYTLSWNAARRESVAGTISTRSQKIFVAACGGATVRHIISDHYLFLNRGGIFCRGGGGGACSRGWMKKG
jgi:hypothetical protein